MTRPVQTILLESVIIGLMNVTIFYILKNVKRLDVFWLLFLSGALIHIIFEYTGGNKWWCEQTYKL
jgi:hypothetical protein